MKTVFLTLFLCGLVYANPVVDIRQESGSTAVYMGQDKILDLKDNRHLVFRATDQNDHWIGQVNRPADLGWSYQDLPGYVSDSVTHQVQPGFFQITLTGRKTQVEGNIITVITAQWNAQSNRFEYTLNSQITADLEKWYLNSKWAIAAYSRDPQSRCQVEAIDYHIERISILDRIVGENPNGDLYDCFVLSGDYTNWQRVPKLHVAYPIYKGNWIYTFDIPLNGYFGFLDPDEGGWISHLTSSTADARIEICWSWQDIHFVLKDCLPPRYSDDTFTASYTWKFVPVDPAVSQQIMTASAEIDWKTRPEYIRPVFSRSNDFEQLINGYESQHAWFSSDPACKWDGTAGFNSSSSVCIEKTAGRIAAWYGWFYGYPFDSENIDTSLTYRLSAKVKTQNCDGAVRLAAVRIVSGPGWLYSNLYPENSWVLESVTSKTITGTKDWTELDVVFSTRDWSPTIVSLEMTGGGKCWFDDVKITKSADMNKDGRIKIADFSALASE